MRKRNLLITSVALAAMIPAALAQPTGSRIEKSSDQPVNIIRFDTPGEIIEIRRLIADGHMDEAIDMAKTLLRSDGSAVIQYAGLNALCVSYSAAKRLEEAKDACDRAIKIRPKHWMALNSRGSVHLIAGRSQDALRDYRAALENLPNKSPMADIVRNNIALAQKQLESSS